MKKTQKTHSYKQVCKTKKVCIRKLYKKHYKKQNQFGGMSDEDILDTIRQKERNLLNVKVIKKDKLDAEYVSMAQNKQTEKIILTNGIATCIGIGFSFIDETDEFKSYLAHLSPIDINTPKRIEKLGEYLDKKHPDDPIFLFRSAGFDKNDLPLLRLLSEKNLLDHVQVYQMSADVKYYKDGKSITKFVNEWDPDFYYGLDKRGEPIGYYFGQ